MQSDGSNQLRLTNNNTDNDFPAWSPDGKFIVFSNLDLDWNICLMQSDGSGMVKLTNNGRSNTYPTWN